MTILPDYQILQAYAILERLREYCKDRGGECNGCQFIDDDAFSHRHNCYLRDGLADWIHAEYWALMGADTEKPKRQLPDIFSLELAQNLRTLDTEITRMHIDNYWSPDVCDKCLLNGGKPYRDCITLSKSLTEYADYIEYALKEEHARISEERKRDEAAHD